MKRTHKRILRWLNEGARIWAAAGERRAWVILDRKHPNYGPEIRVRVSTMRKMVELGLILNMFGVWNEGSEYSDNIWTTPELAQKGTVSPV